MSGAETPAAHAVLGVLDLDDGIGHGYDLARHFAAGQPLAEVLRLEPGMLYHHLKKLAQAGWATARTEHQGTRPPRRVYHITESGRAELRRWLSEPVGRTREIRLEFLVKFYFARRLDPTLAERLITDQREIFARLEDSLASQLAKVRHTDGQLEQDLVFRQLVIELRLGQTRAALTWLDHVG